MICTCPKWLGSRLDVEPVLAECKVKPNVGLKSTSKVKVCAYPSSQGSRPKVQSLCGLRSKV